MPLYEKASTVVASVRSVLAQSRRDFELVVVDDGSTDGGADRVAAIDDPRIRIIPRSNAGVAAARNTGLQAARAPVVAFIDADDCWDEDLLETLMRLRERYPAARVWASGYRVVDGLMPARDVRLGGLPDGFDEGVLDDYFAVAIRSEPPVCASALVIDRDALLGIGGFPAGVTAGEDLLTWARLAERHPIAYSRRARATVRVPGADGRPGRRPQVPDRVGAELATLRRGSARRYCAHWHRMRGMWFLECGDGPGARRELGRAVLIDPLNAGLWLRLAFVTMPGRVRASVERALRRRPTGPAGQRNRLG